MLTCKLEFIPGKKGKRLPFRNRRRVLTVTPPGPLLGSEPLQFFWDCPEPNYVPKTIFWFFDDYRNMTIIADKLIIKPASSVLPSILQGQRKLFELVYHSSDKKTLFLDIAVALLPWPNATSIVETLNSCEYMDVSDAFEEVSSETTWDEFFKDLFQAREYRPRAVAAEYQHPDLVCVLRGYQVDAVHWMVERESAEISLNFDWIPEVADFVTARNGGPLLYNKYSQTISDNFEASTISKGGILADEMGLGKTVITLALVLKNKCPYFTTAEVEPVEATSGPVVVKNRRRIESCADSAPNSPIIESNDDSSVEEKKPRRKKRRRARKLSDSDESPDKSENVTDPSKLVSGDEYTAIVNNKNKRRRKSLRKIKDIDDSSGDTSLQTQRMKNQEGYLNADEKLQLVPPRPKTSGTLRSKLNEWYASKLAEVSCSPTKHQRSSRSLTLQFRCICGGEENRVPRDGVACPVCKIYQHRSCVQYNRDRKYLCPACWKDAAKIASGATLVVTPPAIFEQWGSEIERHAPGLKLFMYNGVNRNNFVQPTHLAEYDIVLTTYTVLSSETLLTEKAPERNMRNESRFLRLSSPLTCISWWRVVCDEAQLVESDVSRVNQMVQQLNAVHRWSVTGTPIQRSIGDLYYLTQFIGLGPLDEKSKWVDFLLKPYLAGCKKPLLSVLNQVFWRSSKDIVKEELGLPEQTFRPHRLTFSAIEQTFYSQEHGKCSNKFALCASKAGVDNLRTLDSINKSTLKKLLQPLLSLRQACTHPQVVSGVSIGSMTGAANLSELSAYMSRKARYDAEEALRHHIGALNGIAGLHCLRFEWAEAVDKYRMVFRLAEEYKDRVKVDAYQRIHALYNAADVIENYKNLVPPTLRDGNLMQEALELEENYRSKAADVFNTSLIEAKTFSVEIEKTRKLFHSAPDAWWVLVILSLRGGFEHEIIEKLHIDLDTNDKKEVEVKDFIRKLTTLRSVEIIIAQWWKAIEKERNTVVNAIYAIAEVPLTVLVESAVACHLRTCEDRPKSSRCELCKVEKAMIGLECQLFASHKKKVIERTHKIDLLDEGLWDKRLHGSEAKYSWKPNYAERTLSIVTSFARNKQLNEQWIYEDSKHHMQLLEQMKKQFRQIRNVWKELNHMVQCEDELEMSKIRLRFSILGEEYKRISRPLDITQPDKAASIHVIDRHQVDPMLVSLQEDSRAYLSTFKRKLGQVIYLENLGTNSLPDPCPVCKSPLDEQWCALQCGHCFCIECTKELIFMNHVSCPICRESTSSTRLSFVDTKKSVATDNDVTVLGDFSTKVDAIVRTALELLKSDPTTKILIFSTWIEVLRILQKALNLNNVTNLLLAVASSKRTLQNFRDPASNVSVLLLPIKLGSKGLNLVEATHVFLVEPILNPSEELQAIGRVHRIGQTKPTIVHRFLVNGTIEEKIQNAISEAKDNNWSNSTVTVGDLKKLFVPSEEPDDD